MITEFEYIFIIIKQKQKKKKYIDSDIIIFTEIFSVIIDFTAILSVYLHAGRYGCVQPTFRKL